MGDSAAGPVIEVTDLVKRYGATVAADGLSFAVGRGGVTALLGPNGAGKTTTVECCEGFRRPDAGRVRVLGLDPLRDGRRLRPRVGVMLQEGAGLPPSARPLELLTHLARLHAHPVPVEPLAERLGLAATRRTPVRRLSGGQRQRLALALAVVGRPELVVLDEPTAGLDPQARRATWELVGELREDGVTVLLTTHLMDEAEQLADDVVIVDHGRVVARGAPSALTAGDGGGTVQFSAPPRLDTSTLRAALPEHALVEETAPGRYRVSGQLDPQLLATVTAWCATHGVLPQGLAVGRRTLEDVFLDLTGRELR
ncbi:MAG TPA: ABC transporter ATP-binding protein [Jiangellales bacterium]|nr:ABC transporter ATP-binding protein [Jiangellales bacterium]